jgi:hypothetical protein
MPDDVKADGVKDKPPREGGKVADTNHGDDAPPRPGDPAHVGGKDVDAAVGFWRKHSSPEFRNLITAKEDTGHGQSA